jgi:ABC-2 type transport system permease protein
MIFDRETAILYKKELRQLAASKTALISSALVPIMLLGVMPMLFLKIAAAGASQGPGKPLPPDMHFGMLGEMHDDPRRLPVVILPVFIAMAGLILPTMNATFLLITERERRTLELLVALPVRIDQVLKAKLAAVLTAVCAVTLPLLAVDMVVFAASGVAHPRDVLGLPVLMVAVLSYGTAASLLISLLAKDFRAANNLAGAVLAPTLLVTFTLQALLPGGIVRPLIMALAYFVAASVLDRVTLKTVTFERLLS